MDNIKLSNAHYKNEVNQFAKFPIHYKEERCSYCGSMSPAKLVEAINTGIRVSFADRKYGWPHKLYLESSYEGLMKFYIVHLRDATEEEAEIIAKACGLRFKFDSDTEGDVSWSLYEELQD